MNHTDYWKEAVSSAMDEIGVVLSPEQVLSCAKNMEISHENIGLCFGVVENPLRFELDREKQKRKTEAEAHEEQLEGIRKGVAIRRHCDPWDVTIAKNGTITYDGPRW